MRRFHYSIASPDVVWQVLPAPPNAANVHAQLLNKLDDLLYVRGLHIDEGQSGLYLVTVVNASRIEADINRDMGRIKDGKYSKLIKKIFSFSCAGLDDKEKIVIILIPVRDVPTQHVSRAKALTAKIAGCNLILEIFVDFNAKKFLDCKHNIRELNSIIEYLFK